MPKRKFDPRLKAAMAEISEVLKRYDIAGHVVLVSPTHSEYHTDFPTWSMAQWEHNEKGEVGIRFNTRREVFATPKGKLAAVEASAHILDQFRHNATMHFGMMEGILHMLGEHLEIHSDIKAPHPHDAEGEQAALDPHHQAGPRRRGYAP